MFDWPLFIGIFLVLYYIYFRKKKPRIDTSKDSRFYMKEFPELFKDFEEPSSQKSNVVINVTNYITNNNLHLYSTDEGKQHHQR